MFHPQSRVILIKKQAREFNASYYYTEVVLTFGQGRDAAATSSHIRVTCMLVAMVITAVFANATLK